MNAKAGTFDPAYSTHHLTILEPDYNFLTLAWRNSLHLASQPFLRQVSHQDGTGDAIRGMQNGRPELTVPIISLSHATHSQLNKELLADGLHGGHVTTAGELNWEYILRRASCPSSV